MRLSCIHICMHRSTKKNEKIDDHRSFDLGVGERGGPITKKPTAVVISDVSVNSGCTLIKKIARVL